MGLLRKTKRAHKAGTYQATKCSEPFDLTAGMVVEVYKDGRWQAGEVQDGYVDLFDPPYMNLASFDEYPIRKVTAQGVKRATDHYWHEITELEAKINHSFEKEQIAELQEKVNGLVENEPLASQDVAKKPTSVDRSEDKA